MEIVGVDTGGTFTDFIYKFEKGWGVHKLLSSPANPAESLLKGLNNVISGSNYKIVHGSTVATNAILERKGAYTAFITNKGFEDIIEIGRQNRTQLYNLNYKRNPQLVPKELRFGIDCRIDSQGSVVKEIDDSEIEYLLRVFEKIKPASIAVCFLFSYLNPKHELAVYEGLSSLDVPISLSHKILSEFREYERASTTIINAYVSPKMKRYIKNIIEETKGNELRIMQSNGGSISADVAMRESVRTILSGPAGGVVGAFEIGKTAGYTRLITFDMGGTSTDVALIDNALPLTFESQIADFPVKVPMIDIHTVGAGGGSIAYIDRGDSLKVGPESAGADPGPICYGKGENITVTDANLYLGRIVPEYFLGGNMVINKERIIPFFKSMAKKIGLTEIELAQGILDVANSSMEKAIRVISVEKGFDPREFTLFSFGGAGGMHAAFLAKLLHIPKVFIPKNPGILSAIGMLMADIIKDYSLTVMLDSQNTDYDSITRLFSDLDNQGVDDLKKEGIEDKDIIIEHYIDMRYFGQSYEIMVPFDENYQEAFHNLHEKNYGYCDRSKNTEIVNIRVRARGIPQKPEFDTLECSKKTIDHQAILDVKDVVFDSRFYKTKIINRDLLKCGNVIEGSAIIVEYSSTISIPPDCSAVVDKFGNIIIEIQGEE